MADNYFSVQSVKFYKFWKNSYRLGIVYNKQWNRYLLDITRKFNYTKNGETKEGFCTTLLIWRPQKRWSINFHSPINLQRSSGQPRCENL